MKVRFIILFPDWLNRFVVKYSKQIRKKYKTYFVIDNKKLFPHITLFKADISKKELKNLYKKIRARAKTARPFEIKTGDGYVTNGWIFLSVQSKKISGLRRTLIKDAAGAGGKFLKPTYRFNPHITLAKLKINRERAKSINLEFPKINRNFKLKTIAIGLSDSNGQVYKILRKFHIHGK